MQHHVGPFLVLKMIFLKESIFCYPGNAVLLLKINNFDKKNAASRLNWIEFALEALRLSPK